MRIICPIHGLQKVRYISPDFWEGPKNTRTVEVIYEYDGLMVNAFLLSEEFAKKHDIKGGVSTLPNDYPPWTEQATSVCEKCFVERCDGPGKL